MTAMTTPGEFLSDKDRLADLELVIEDAMRSLARKVVECPDSLTSNEKWLLGVFVDRAAGMTPLSHGDVTAIRQVLEEHPSDQGPEG